MKALLPLLLTVAATLTTGTATAAPVGLPVKHCINFGGMLDADWGKKPLGPDDFARVSQAGFDTIRLPVDWDSHTSRTPPYTIDPAWMDKVAGHVDNGLAWNLNIILDFHYYDALMINPKANTARFTAIWRQIARRFASRPDGHLWFELLNEPVKGITNANLMDVLGPALKEVRRVSPKRPVIIGGQDASWLTSLPTLNLPNDPQVWPTLHYYEPFGFTHQGAFWVKPTPVTGRKYGRIDDQKRLERDLNITRAFIARTGKIPLMGETGAINQIIPDDQRALYMGTMVKAFGGLGIAVCPWSYTNTFDLYEWQAKRWRPGMLSALGLPEPKAP